MKRYINIIIAVYIVTLILSTKANAEWWTDSRISGGPIYALEEHPDIALEKALIIYQEKGDCKVHFLFKNNGNKPVSAKVAVPVEFIVPIEIVSLDPAEEILMKIFGEENFENLGEGLKAKASILNTNKRLMFDKNKFNYINTWWEDYDYKWVYYITIFQDDKDISIDSVLVEAKITTEDTAYIQFHFLHELLFKPSSISHVTVEYSISSVRISESYGTGPDYQWHYALGTGSTWNGPIDAIYLAIPEYLTPNLPKAFTRVGNLKKNAYYIAKNYEPLVNDKINIDYFGYGGPPSYDELSGGLDEGEIDAIDTREIIQLEEPQKPAQSFVVVKNASSYLSQKTWVNSTITMDVPFDKSFWSVFSYLQGSSNTVKWAHTTYENIGFESLSLFDGIPESAWCEGVPGDGIGEWVEFELIEDVLGLGIHNGFKKVNWFLQATHGNQLEQLNAVYTNNNRVKVLEIISNDGKTKQEIKLWDTPMKQSFESIYLPKGLYKVYIRDIYKGNKYEDTCLGEIEFYSASARSIVEQDEFFKKVFHVQPVQIKFQNETADLSDASQEFPSYSKSGSKNFVIVWSGHWQEGQKTGNTIYAQRFSSDGEKLGHSFKVSDEEGTDAPISPNISASSPAVAIDGSGNFVVTWHDVRNRNINRPGFSNEDIYAQRYANNGTPLGSNFKVNDDPGNADDYRREFQTYPSISMDGNGNFVIAWSDARNDFVDKDIYAQRYASDETALGRNFRVNNNQGSVWQNSAPSVSMDDGGNFVITWEDTRDSLSFDQDIYAQRYSSDGTALGPNFRVNDDHKNASGSCPAVSCDGSGNFVITWAKHGFSHKGGPYIYAQRYSSDGTALGSNFKVSSFFGENMMSAIRPFIASDEQGNFIIGWQDGHDNVINIYAQRYASDGTALGSKFKVNDSQSIVYEEPPSISTYGNGNFIIWWNDARKFGDDARSGGYSTDIYAQRYSRDGTAIGSNFRVNDRSR